MLASARCPKHFLNLSQKIMTWSHPSVKQNKSTASSAGSFYYLFLASRRVYKTAAYCISRSYPLPPFISVWRLSFRRHRAAPLFAKSRQSPVLNMQPPQRCPFAPSSHLSIATSLFCTRSFLPIFPFPSPFPSKLESNRCSPRKYRHCQRIHWICCTIDPLEASWGWEWDERDGELEVWTRSGEEWRPGNCIRGVWLKITPQSLNRNRSCLNLLPLCQSPNAVKWEQQKQLF